MISGVWPPAVTSSSLSPSRRLGKHYTHPTAKATQPKPRETCTETLGLPRFLALQDGQRRQPGSGLVLWTASQSGMLPWAGAIGPTHQVSSPGSTAPQTASPPPAGTRRYGPQPPQTQPPQTTTPQNARNLAMVKFLTEAPRAALPGLPRHRQPKDLPRAGQRDGRDEGSPGWGSWPGPAHQLAPRPVLGTVAGCWHRGRLLARWPARPPGGGFWTAQVFKQLGPRCMRRGPGAGVEGGVLNAGEPRPCGWGSRPFFL